MLGELATKILSALSSKEWVLSTDLGKSVGQRIHKATLDDLLEDGLIRTQTEGAKRFFCITPNGRRMLRMTSEGHGRPTGRQPFPTELWQPTPFSAPRGPASMVAFSLPSLDPLK